MKDREGPSLWLIVSKYLAATGIPSCWVYPNVPGVVCVPMEFLVERSSPVANDEVYHVPD